jgi:bacteriorhodopsin
VIPLEIIFIAVPGVTFVVSALTTRDLMKAVWYAVSITAAVAALDLALLALVS